PSSTRRGCAITARRSGRCSCSIRSCARCSGRKPRRRCARRADVMRILHVLDHSAPLHSGYAFRTLAIPRESQALGWETVQLTSPNQGGSPAVREETVDGWRFHRTPPVRGLVTDFPGMGEIELMGELAHRIETLVRRYNPHVLHVHSPVLNALPALRVGRRTRVPVLYEVRALWEDAAVDHGTTR